MERKGLRAVKKAKAWRAMAFVRWNRPCERKFGAILARKKLCAVDSRRFQPISGALELPCGDFPCPRGRFPPHGASSAPIQAIFSTRILGGRSLGGRGCCRCGQTLEESRDREVRGAARVTEVLDARGIVGARTRDVRRISEVLPRQGVRIVTGRGGGSSAQGVSRASRKWLARGRDPADPTADPPPARPAPSAALFRLAGAHFGQELAHSGHADDDLLESLAPAC